MATREAEIGLIILVVITLLLLGYFLRKCQFSYMGQAPGPWRFPLIGTLPSAIVPALLYPAQPWKALQAMSKKYGDFFSLSAGSNNFVVLSSYEVMQELLNNDDWSAKMNYAMFRARSNGKELGIAFVQNPKIWVEMRKFSLRTLRDFGFGKRVSMQGIIEAELSLTLKEISESLKKTNGILRIDNNFGLSVVNIFWAMVAGVRYSHDDPKLLAMLALTTRGAKLFSLMNPRLIFPTLDKWMSKVMKNIGISNFGHDFFKELSGVIQPLFDESKTKGTYLNEPENFVEVFLQKIKTENGNPDSVYTEEQLMILIQDFWLAGSVTTSAVISYAIFFLVLNPEVQRKVQAEIDEHIPSHSIPTLEDIQKMPYTQATILEIHRLAAVVPFPIPRLIVRDTWYKGWKVPKGTCVMVNHWAVHMDKEYWGDPEVFRPERFINDRGDYVQDKHVVHFGFGKRYCIGVPFVNSVVPIHMATLCQKFQMSLVPGENSPELTPNVGMSLTPYPFNIVMTARDERHP